MPGTTRFTVQGRCPGLAPYQLAEAEALADDDLNGLPVNPAAHPGLWRFNYPRRAGSAWRQNGVHLKSPWPVNVANCSWTSSQSGWPPADRSETQRGEAARSSSAVSRSRAFEVSRGFAPRPPSTEGAFPSACTSGGVTVSPSAIDGSSLSLQQQALLQLLGPSTSANHATGLSLMAGAATGLAAVFTPQLQPRSNLASTLVGERGPSSEEAFRRDPVTARPSAWERPMPLAQLQAACLASVAAALVQFPRVWSEQAPALPGLLLCSWNPNAWKPNCHLGQAAWPHPPLPQPRQALSQQGSSAGPAAGAAGRQASHGPPASCTASGAWKMAGRQNVAGAPPPAALALAVGAAAAGTASASSTEASMGLLYTVERTDSGCCGHGTSLEVGTGGRGGSISSSSSGGAAAGCWGQAAGEGAKRSTPLQQPDGPGPVQVGQPAASVAGAAVAAGEEEEERAKEAERPKVFDNPIRYCKLLFAGAMSAVVSRTCVAPLERVKMDLLLKNGTGDAFTTAAQVLRTEGIAGFWKGNALNVLRTAPFKAVNFFSFDMYRTAFIALSGREENLERFLAGACAGVTATLVCFPLDVVRTRLMASVVGPRYGNGPFTTLAGILRNEGAAALYSGCLPAVIGMAPAGAVFYGVYDMLKHRHLDKVAAEKAATAEADGEQGANGKGSEAAGPAEKAVQQPPTLDPLYTLMYGAMAGAASELIVYPLEVIRRKMQLQSMALANIRQIGGMHPHLPHAGHLGPAAGSAAAGAGRLAAAAHHHHHHMLPYHLGAHKMLATLSAAAVANSPGLARVAAAVTAILATDGPRGFYSGLLPNMLQVLPSAALSYYTYDTLKTVLGAR